jgi:glycerol-3-phosphate dehydrogenase
MTLTRDLGALAGREHDLLVIGGGIHGAAVAWDAAQRGLKVALVEAADFGSGTSWNSLKTIHGGLRHLQRADLFGLRESARERTALLRIAPEVVEPRAFLVPTYGHGRRGREAFAVGLRVNDLLTRGRNAGLPAERWIPPSRILSPEEALAQVSGLEPEGLTGAALWHDAQVTSTERLLMGFLRAAAEAGAVLANQAEVTGLANEGGRVAGARLWDRERSAELLVRARLVVNAAGPALDRIRRWAGISRPPVPLLRACNLVLRRPLVTEAAVGGWAEGRFLFLVPWRDRCAVGTSYVPAEGEGAADPAAAFLEDVVRAFPWAGIEAEDVCLVHRGLVPGRGGARGLWTRGRLLDHEAADGMPGLISLLTVKYTTARAAAQRAVDLACRRLGRAAAPCRTATTALTWARPLLGSLAERARVAVREEMALHLDDAVLRRLDLGTAGAPRPGEVEAVAAAMAAELGWDPARQRAEREGLVRALAAAGAA